MGVALALVAALAYGLSDFVGGLLSRRTSAWPVAVVGALAAAAGTTALAVAGSGSPRPADFAWAAAAGVGSGSGAGFLYRGFAAGRMGVVGPISAVGAAVVPLLAGLGGGERPTALAWAGILVALPAIWLVSREPGGPGASREMTAAGLADGVLAGIGFGLLFAALGQVPDRAGLWPLAVTQLVSVPAVVVLAVVLGEAWLPRQRAAWPAVWCGLLSTVATGAFLLASQRGLLTISSILASLYPAVTIVLAALVLREPVHRAQGVGLLLCAVAVVLVAVG